MKMRRGSALLAVLLIVLAASLIGLSLVFVLRERERAAVEIAAVTAEAEAEDSLDAVVAELQRRLSVDPKGRPAGPEVVVVTRQLRAPLPITAADPRGRPGRYARTVARSWPANAFIDINTDPEVLKPVFKSLLKIGLKDEARRDGGPAYDGASAAAVTSFAFARLQELRPEGGLYRSPEEALRRLRLGIASDLRSEGSESSSDDLLIQALNEAVSQGIAAEDFQRELGRLDRVLRRLVERRLRAAARALPSGGARDARGWSFSVPLHLGLDRFRGDFTDPTAAPANPGSFGPILTTRAAVIGSATLALPQATRRPVSPIAVNEAPMEVLAAVFAAGLRYAEASVLDPEDTAIELAIEVETLRRSRRFTDFADFETRVTSVGIAGVDAAFFDAFDFESRFEIDDRLRWGDFGNGVLAASLIAAASPGGALPPPLCFQGDGLCLIELETAALSLPPQRLDGGGDPLVQEGLETSGGVESLEDRLRVEGELEALRLATALVQVYEPRRLGSAGGWRDFAETAAPELASWPQDLAALEIIGDDAVIENGSALGAGLIRFARRPAPRFFAPLRDGVPDLQGVGAVFSATRIGGAFTDSNNAALPLAGSPLPASFFGLSEASRQTAEGLVLRLPSGGAARQGERLRWEPGASGGFDNLDVGGLAFWVYFNAAPESAQIARFDVPILGGQRGLSIALRPGPTPASAELIVELERGVFSATSSTRWGLDPADPVDDLEVDAWHLIALSWNTGGLPVLQIDGAPRGTFTADAAAAALTPLPTRLELGLVSQVMTNQDRFIILREASVFEDSSTPEFDRNSIAPAPEASFGEPVPAGSRLLSARVIGADIGAADILVDLGLTESDQALGAEVLSFDRDTRPFPSNPRLLAPTIAPTRLRARVSFAQDLGPIPARPRRLRSITAYLAPPRPLVYAWRRPSDPGSDAELEDFIFAPDPEDG